MFDTICIKSPYLNRDVANHISNECTKRQGIQCKTGEIIYEITTGTLVGSYDNRVSIRIKDYIFSNEDGSVFRRSVPPYLEVECSVNKLFLGHNLFGNDDLKDIGLCCNALVRFIEESFNVELPLYVDWYIVRADFAMCYDIGYNNVVDWFRQMNNIYYPRRTNVVRHGLNGIMFPGSTTTLKFYNKYDEFKKHDYKRLKVMDLEYANKLLDFSYGLLRVEVEVKKRKLQYDLNVKGDILVKKVLEYNFEDLFYNEIKKVLKMGDVMEIKNDSLGVEKRLMSKYKPSLASTVFSTWLRLSVFGYDKVKEDMSESTFYRHIKYLREAGCSWHNTDIEVSDSKDNIIPVNFMLLDSYKVKKVDEFDFSNVV